jgi:hypothetical protein
MEVSKEISELVGDKKMVVVVFETRVLDGLRNFESARQLEIK